MGFEHGLQERLMSRFRKAYGDSPLHLLATAASFAIVGYGFFMIFQSPAPESTILFFVAAIVAHDLIAFPLYSGLNFVAGKVTGEGQSETDRAGRVPAINYLRVPFILSAISFVMFFPLILGLSADRYEASTGLDAGIFLGRWLGICAVLFTGSALLYAMRLRRAGSRADGEEVGG
jgi:hypothetical protein